MAPVIVVAFVGVTVTTATGTGAGGFNCRTSSLENPLNFAVKVTVCVAVVDDTLAVNPALVAFAGTTAQVGTTTVGLLLVRLIPDPPTGATPFKVTVQASVPDPVMEALLQETALKAVMPVPLSPMTAVGLVESLLVTVN